MRQHLPIRIPATTTGFSVSMDMTTDRSLYIERRKNILAALTARDKKCALILCAATGKVRNSDCEYPFRQDSDFWYLTGFNEPDAVLVLLPGREDGEAILFCRKRDKERELWDGHRVGQSGAVDDYGFDQAFAMEELDARMPQLLRGCRALYYRPGHNKGFDMRMWRWLHSAQQQERKGGMPLPRIEDRDSFLHRYRMIKSEEEQQIMRTAADISARAHVRAMRECQAGRMEYQLEASILHDFALQGARYPAYSPIVGGGENACILHYTANNAPLRDGDLVLIDAGCELDHYAADITRTFPVNGRFTKQQKALYEVVLKAQEAAIACIAPGLPWDGFHKAAVESLVEGLLELGLLKGDKDAIIKEKSYQKFYMHGTGHWLGLDVHDAGVQNDDGSPVLFEPGMALTVEPGLYIASSHTDIDSSWHGMGIRIEDDILVTKDGCDVMTAGVPKTVEDIEATMAASTA